MRASPFGSSKLPVAVLGATGAVGQAFVRLLAAHPWFELAEVAASERSAGRSYAEAARWLRDTPIPDHIARLTVQPCDPKSVRSPVVFSALDSSVAGEAEAAFARAGRAVLSNAKNYLVGGVPPYNPMHEYTFVLDTRLENPGRLHFGVSDGGYACNSGAYTVTVLQLLPK